MWATIIAGAEGTGGGSTQQQQQQLRFGSVARDARAASGEAAFWVGVEVLPGSFRDLLSTELYSFRSSSSAAAHGGATADAASPAAGMAQHSSPSRPVALRVDAAAVADGDTAGGGAAEAPGAAASAELPPQPPVSICS